MITATIRKEAKNFKEEIKKIDTTIKTNKNKIKSLIIAKQKLEYEKIKQFAEIKKLNKSININEIYQIEKQIQKNNEQIAKLKDKLPTITYSIKRWKGDITTLKEAIVAEIVNEEQLDDEIRAIEIIGTNLEQKVKNFNDDNLNKKLALSKLKLKMIKLAVKLEKRTVKTKKIFCKIGQNKLAIANKYLLIKQEHWHLSPSIKAEKEVLDARLHIRLRYKMSNMCDVDLNISKRNLKLAKIDKKIARLNISIDKKNIEIKGCHETIREIYNSQSIKTQIKVLLKSPFTWLNKQFQKYKYEITLNQYQTQLKKLEKEITKLESGKPGGYFYNKFWVIISCGRYDNRRKEEIKEEKKAKLYEIKQKIYELKNQANVQLQPPTSSNLALWNEASLQLNHHRFNEVGDNDDKGFTSSF